MVSEANGVAIILWSQDQSGASQRGKDVHFEWTRIQKTCLSELHWLVGGKRALPSDVASTNGQNASLRDARSVLHHNLHL